MSFELTPIFWGGMIVLGVFLILESAIRIAKYRIKLEYERARSKTTDLHELELLAISFFKKSQAFDIARVVIVFIAVLLGFLLYDVQAFSYLVLALSAFIIVMKENVNSLIGYLYILFRFDIGDDIRVNETLGEIIRIRPFVLSLAGKDDNGDLNGKLIEIPNFMVLQHVVEIQGLKTENYRRTSISAVYDRKRYEDPFEVWIENLKEFLSRELPLRTVDQVGYYRGYAGIQFKLNYEYQPDGGLLVKISFVTSPLKAIERKERIVAYIESTKRVTPLPEEGTKKD